MMANKPLVLVIDDDPVVRMFACDVLGDGGYGTLVASSADEGLAILENRPDVDTVLTDVVTPGTLDGLALASLVRKRWPAKRIVVASGWMPAEAAGNARDTTFLAKPFAEAELLAAMAEGHASHA